MKSRAIFKVSIAIRQLLPPSMYVVLAFLVIAGLEGVWYTSRRVPGAADHLLLMRDGVILFLMGGYGIYRVAAFHPLFRPKYLEWLEQTPWCPGLPLPLGPVRLAWPDIVIAGGLGLLLCDPRQIANPQLSRISAVTGYLTFMQAYAVTSTVTVWLTRPRGAAYLAAFLIALSARLSVWSPIASLVCLVAGIVTDDRGLRQSWHLFPWRETTDWGRRLKTDWKSMQTRAGQGISEDMAPDRVPPAELGWPFGVCSPYVAPKLITTREKLLIAALLGFWVHALMSVTDGEFIRGVAFLALPLGGFVLLLLKLAPIGANFLPPIDLRGRLLTMRWFIPGYDMILVGPLIILVLIGAGAEVGHFVLQIPADILVPSVVTIVVSALSVAGPNPDHWMLTAPARIVPGRLNRSVFEELS